MISHIHIEKENQIKNYGFYGGRRIRLLSSLDTFYFEKEKNP